MNPYPLSISRHARSMRGSPPRSATHRVLVLWPYPHKGPWTTALPVIRACSCSTTRPVSSVQPTSSRTAPSPVRRAPHPPPPSTAWTTGGGPSCRPTSRVTVSPWQVGRGYYSFPYHVFDYCCWNMYKADKRTVVFCYCILLMWSIS